MQMNWYPNDGAGSGTGNVYDGGGGYYGGENMSFYGPPAMGPTDYTDKLKPTGFDGTSCYPGGGSSVAGPIRGDFPGGFDGAVTSSNACPVLPYQNAIQGLGPLQHQAPVGMLYNQTQMMAPTVMGSNNDYQQQQQHHQPPHVPSSNHHHAGGAYQPFCQALPPPSHQQSSYGTELGKSSEVVSQNLMSGSGTASFLEQPYVAANYAPCQGPPPWNYAYCYGYYGQEPCPFVNMVDMEDFMNNEKRKEKSRDAARCRRSRETEIFQDLASLLPMRPEEVEHLDKASVMRLSIAYLKARTMLELFPDILSGDTVKVKEDNDVSMDSTDEFNFNESKLSLKSLGLEPEAIALQTLDGFLMILSADGDVTYISENVSEYLGISQIDIMGQPIWDYSHQCDHDELREALNGRHHSPSELLNGVANSDCRPMENRDFFLRLKCTLTSRGRSVNIKSASYKVLHITGHIACKDKEGQRQLVAIARPLPHPANIEVPLGSSTFLTQHTLSMKFSYVDEMMLSLLGYQPSDLLGKSLYDCHHATDAEHLMATFKHVISKGQSETCRYRFLAKTGGYAWVVTQATVIYDKQKPHSVVCVNYVLSGVENKDDILSCAQLEARQQLSSDEPEQCNKISNKSVVCSSSDQLSIEQRPAAISLPSIGGADPEQVKVEETIPIPVQSSTAEASYVELIANNSAEQAKRNEPLAASGGKVLLCVKNDTPAAVSSEPVPNTRILRELNSIPAVPKPSAASGSRPVSVTASIFTSLPSGASGFGTEKSRAFNKPTVSGTPAQQSSATGSPQSVTAKLFVTLPPAVGGACTTSCNPGSNGGVSGSKPQHATEKIFAPRTEDMNKGFLMFSEEEPGLTMLKDEPDDLTHLAPTAGDACIPLEESGTFFNEMFEDFIIPDSYTLLQDELCSLDSQDTRLEASTIVSQSGTIGIPVSVSDSLTNGLNVTSVTSSPLGCTTSGTDGVPSLLIPNSGAGTNGSQALQNNRSPNTNASSSSPSSVSLSSSPVPSSPSRSHTSSNPNSPSGTSGLGSSASSTISTIDGRRHSTIGGSNHQHNATSNDPFINYRDEVNEVSPSPHLLSPGISKSPESSSLPSLCSPNGSLPEDELAFMSLNMDELDLSMRAPYISMSEVDDLPLLTSDDLLWGVPAATIEGNNSGTSISAFGLSGKFFIKDEFNTIGTSSNGPDNSTLGDQQDPSAVQHSLTVDKEHSLIMNGADTGSKNASITLNSSNGTIELSANNSNNDSKATLTTAAPASIDSSLAALLCGGTVISIQSEKSNVSQQSQPIGNQILTPHANSSLNAGNQQEHQRTNNQPQQHLHEQQFQLNSAQQRQEAPVNGKRIKLTEQNLHSMVVLPANVKLCDTWKFDDLLQLNGTVTTNAKGITQQGTVPQANIIASFVTTAAKKSAGSASVNGNNKRTLSGVSESTGDTGTGNNCKRLKSSATTTPSSAPQLLQQLMAPSPLPQKLKSKSRSSQDGTAGGRWPNGHAGANGGLLQEQSGNSVLMNLLVSGCDKTIPLTPPEVLIENATEFSSDGNEMQCDNGTGNMLYGLGDDDDGGGVLFSSTNPLIGGQRPLNDPIARPLTIQTDSILPGTIGNDGAVQGNAGSDRFRSGKLYATASATSSNQPTTIATPMDEFSMIVSPSLLTPTDMEIWRAIQQGQLDPKKITSVYGAGTTGSHIPKSLSSTPTAHLSAELLGGDGSEANLLATLDGDEFGGLGELAVSKDRTGSFRTIAANDGGALHHQGMLI